jgi:hypothetical protein
VGEDLDGRLGERIGIPSGGGQQLGGCGIVEKAGQRFLRDREVAVEHQLAGRSAESHSLLDGSDHPDREREIAEESHPHDCPAR